VNISDLQVIELHDVNSLAMEAVFVEMTVPSEVRRMATGLARVGGGGGGGSMPGV